MVSQGHPLAASFVLAGGGPQNAQSLQVFQGKCDEALLRGARASGKLSGHSRKGRLREGRCENAGVFVS